MSGQNHLEPGVTSYWVVNWTKKNLSMIAYPEKTKVKPRAEVDKRLSPELKEYLGLKRFPEVRSHTKCKGLHRVYEYEFMGQRYWLKTKITITRRDHNTLISGMTAVIKENEPPTEVYKVLFQEYYYNIKFLHVPSVIVNSDGELMTANPAFNKELKKRANKWFGKSIHLIFNPGSEYVSFERKVSQNYLADYVNTEGDHQQYEVSSSPFKLDGQLYHILIATAQSMEDRHLFTVNKLKKKVSDLEAVKRHFEKTTTHDLKAPVNRMLGLVEIMEAETEDPQIRKYVEMMRTCARQLHRNANRMLEDIRGDKPDLRAYGDVDIEKLLGHLKNKLEVIARTYQCEVKFRVSTISSKILGWDELIESMLQSVAEMSMRSVPGTLITLEAYQSSKWEVRVRILDRSPSLPSDYVPVVEEAGANGKTPVQTNPWDLEQVNLNAEMLGAEFTVSRRPQLMGNSYNFVFMTEANWN